MTESDDTIQKVLDVRKVGADYEEHQQAGPLDIPVDLHNFTKYPVVDPLALAVLIRPRLLKVKVSLPYVSALPSVSYVYVRAGVPVIDLI